MGGEKGEGAGRGGTSPAPSAIMQEPVLPTWLCICRVYIAADQFEKARALARTDPSLQQYVEQQHTQYLLRNKNADGLASIGNAAEAIEIYARQGDWGRVHQLAEQAGPQDVVKYSVRSGSGCCHPKTVF